MFLAMNRFAIAPGMEEGFEKIWRERETFLAENGLDEHAQEAGAFVSQYRVDHPFPFASLDDLVAHFEHIISLVGVAHVGIGSDFDGVGDSLPTGMKDVSSYPALIAQLLDKGHTPEDIEAILGGNLLRVWRAVEEYPKASQN